MATFRVPSLSLDEEVIPRRTIAYFTRRLQHHLHELVIREFYRLSDNGEMQYSTVMEAQIASTAPSGGDVTRFAAVDSGHISALAAPGEASFTDSAPL